MNRQFTINVSTESVVFGLDTENLNILLIRGDTVYPDIQGNAWKLPGRLIKRNEDPYSANESIFKKLTGLQNIKKHQLQAFVLFDSFTETTSAFGKDTEDKMITIPYYSVIDLNKNMAKISIQNRNTQWFGMKKIKRLNILPSHLEIIKFALETLRNELQTSSLVFEILPKKFSLGQLQKVYEIILGVKIDKRNFRKKIAKLNYIIPLNEKESEVSHRPANLYTFSPNQYKKLFIKHNKMLPFFNLKMSHAIRTKHIY